MVDHGSHGELRGHQLQPRELIDLSYKAGWTEPIHLHQAVSIWFAESNGYDHAFNDNLDAEANIVSRDCGICQINIHALLIGTPAETRLYDPATCITEARKLYKLRGWQPWVAYNTEVYKHPYYCTRSALGLMNWVLAEMKFAPVPVFTLAELRAKRLW